MNEELLLPLFPQVVFVKTLNHIPDEEMYKLKQSVENLDYMKSGDERKENDLVSLASSNINLFDLPDFDYIKKELMREFNSFKNKKLKYVNNDFIFTTSWSTKTEPGHSGEYHNHTNCMYSGVFYIDGDDQSGDISFENFNTNSFQLIPSEYNLNNGKSFKVGVKKKMLIFFPSLLHHKIHKNKSSITRYSLAFNFLPTGKLGNDDSTLFLNL